MRNLFKDIRTFLGTDHVRKAEENYLNGSMDRFDLEYRQRQIDAGLFRKPRAYPF
jgi:hypothetical protein